MKKYLLDSHVLLWSVFEVNKIPKQVQDVLKNSENAIFVSSVSLWEISLKYRLGKLDFFNFDPMNLPLICGQMQYELLPLEPIEASSYHLLQANYHKDPFDRMLIRQAIQQGLILLSADALVAQYTVEGLKVFWQ
ncbi:MAG: type II toxin-antitoxin system VapC family toxin [Saprospiraceae bacterium]|nr:type II toxin-antitoxin system VapC family toxin [Saprospiraceae bacterium]MDZ4706645.1 type II toxin-antitoxin system VapC family toxin [Saprospiraceae bacterium]